MEGFPAGCVPEIAAEQDLFWKADDVQSHQDGQPDACRKASRNRRNDSGHAPCDQAGTTHRRSTTSYAGGQYVALSGGKPAGLAPVWRRRVMRLSEVPRSGLRSTARRPLVRFARSKRSGGDGCNGPRSRCRARVWPVSSSSGGGGSRTRSSRWRRTTRPSQSQHTPVRPIDERIPRPVTKGREWAEELAR